MSKREEYEKYLLSHGSSWDADICLKGYDRGHADGLSEGEELRKELVGKLAAFIELPRSITEDNDFRERVRALIAEAEGI